VLVLPCPGQCLSVARTPASCRPVTAAWTSVASRTGSGPKLRSPMTPVLHTRPQSGPWTIRPWDYL
jgi:hypothetical protein